MPMEKMNETPPSINSSIIFNFIHEINVWLIEDWLVASSSLSLSLINTTIHQLRPAARQQLIGFVDFFSLLNKWVMAGDQPSPRNHSTPRKVNLFFPLQLSWFLFELKEKKNGTTFDLLKKELINWLMKEEWVEFVGPKTHNQLLRNLKNFSFLMEEAVNN